MSAAGEVPEPRLYAELAAWWPLLSPPEDYAEEAQLYHALLAGACDRPPRTLLELGSGGGSTASHLAPHLRLTLVDRSPGMLAVSAALNPGCEHVAGDMRTLRLGRRFDAVLVHDAVAYMATADDLRAALATAAVHCRPGGAALFLPDQLRDTFEPSTDHGGRDGDGRALRYLEWVHDPDPDDDTYTVDYAYLLREADGRVRVEHDRHVLGLFARERWLALLGEAGFAASAVSIAHAAPGIGTREGFLGRRPAG